MADDKHNHMEHFLLEHAPLLRRAVNQLKAGGHLHEGLSIDEADLREHGIVGLLKAARSWEPGTSDKKWHNFALDSIKTHMHQHIKDQDPVHRKLRSQAKQMAPQGEQPATPKIPTEE